MSETLLIELFTEELPPKALPKLGAAFSSAISEELVKLGFAAAGTECTSYASPRRLAVSIPGVLAVQPDQQIEKKGPAVASGFKDGQPTPALLGFARGCGLAADQLDQLEKGSDGKQEVFIFRSQKQGEPLAAVLSGIIEAALKKLPAPKMMRWGDRDGMFIRPVHGLTVLHGANVVPAKILHLESGRVSRGHRFLSAGEVSFAHADEYASKMRLEGKVVASFAERRAQIGEQLALAAAKLNATIAADAALFDEVTALVEWPVVLQGEFEADFLKVPQECLILTMQQNQKYFPLLDANGRLMNQYLLVSNIDPADPSHVVNGNSRVLRARLSDAKFFFEQDQKQKLDARVGKLAHVVYHNKIGSQLERVTRLETIAGEIAKLLGSDAAKATRAAYLAKADLLTDMVGEFPELQGIMGQYYARIDGEDTEVAYAVEAHYKPKFAGDTLPEGAVAQAVSLADKLETLVGIWGIGLIPTGDKDPFALRRAALGVLRMLLQLPLNVRQLLTIAASTFPTGVVAAGTVDGVYGFMLDRLKNYLAADYPAADIDAVLAQRPEQLDEVQARLAAVAEFKALPEAASLAAANKRIRNILKKVEGDLPQLNATLFAQDEERALAAASEAVAAQAAPLLAAGDYVGALTALAALKAPVDAFFDGVMVMADDLAVRGNRLALLNQLAGQMNTVAELALLAE
ncbi:glycine--tRNA ligase subunit beta [Chitinilyticum aquatile]|uniref:glycine--tRNA ligase subunit beta n=1 Tax=Chitinilyticum aquatile TaxID=362520 RepID=UPI00040DA9F0|nr:glycine--tRNA ligase subunit beta [Chitinilyticum aquatile]